jgi:serine/threonine protein kinase
MHQYEARLRDTIAQSCDSVADIPAFENSFGKGKEALFFRLTNLQQSYVLAMDQLLLKHGRESYEIPDDQKKQWMFDQLAGRTITGEHKNLPPGFVQDQNRVGKEVLLRQKKDITAFINLIKSDIRKTAENRNREIAGGIIRNLVKLMYCLKRKRAAIRDMKPDNMFLVGDTDDPDFLIASADQYSLGLIDLETSVSVEETEILQQPILAGTPSFATPSHLFENAVLMRVFQDVPRTFYLQDWFAAIGLIYHVVTGTTLFEKTGKLLPEVVRVRSKLGILECCLC